MNTQKNQVSFFCCERYKYKDILFSILKIDALRVS